MIYATPFTTEPLQCSAPSQPSGFTTYDEVRAAMGEPTVTRRACLIYGDGVERVLFSVLCWSI